MSAKGKGKDHISMAGGRRLDDPEVGRPCRLRPGSRLFRAQADLQPKREADADGVNTGDQDGTSLTLTVGREFFDRELVEAALSVGVDIRYAPAGSPQFKGAAEALVAKLKKIVNGANVPGSSGHALEHPTIETVHLLVAWFERVRATTRKNAFTANAISAEALPTAKRFRAALVAAMALHDQPARRSELVPPSRLTRKARDVNGPRAERLARDEGVTDE